MSSQAQAGASPEVSPVSTDAVSTEATDTGGNVEAASTEEFEQEVAEAIDAGASQKEIQKMVKKFQLKVNGKTVEREIDLSDEDAVRRELQMALAGRGAMQESAELKKLYEQEIKRLKTNPWEVLKDLELDVDDLNEKYLQERIDHLKKSPQQVEREKLEKELTEARAELDRQKKASENARFTALQEQEATKLKEEIDVALSANTQLPKTKGVIAKIADTMLWAMENSKSLGIKPEDVTVSLVLPAVQEEIQQEMAEMFNSMPENMLEEYVGKKNIERMRKKRVNSMKTTTLNNVKATSDSVKKEEPTKQKISSRDFFRNLK